jgi:acyl-CoA reductase-like NAD-dependent aldehyde dehydrogenase
MSDTLKTISPVDGSVYVERNYADESSIAKALELAKKAQVSWSQTSVAERATICSRAIDGFVESKQGIAEEISWMMGRPIGSAPGEVGGLEERARYMISAAEGALSDISVPEKEGFTRFIRRVPLGVTFIVAPWNFPYLTSVNAIIPALMAGNTVILKHSAQTPLCAERYAEMFEKAGLPEGVFQYLHLTHGDTERVIQAPEVDFVGFTGSVSGGSMVERAAAGRFIGVGLELGGKDPAYVRSDADLAHAVENLVDGAFFNSGQSCCGIERIYCHESLYDDFVSGVADLVSQFKLGNPMEPETNLGPVVKTSAAEFVRGQVSEAISQGATALVNASGFAADAANSPYLAPQVLVGVDHSMRVMNEESFGPVVGVMKVASDEQAIQLMNDSEYGLTAAIWSSDVDAAISIGDRIETGTWFMNRCDYLDPALAWTGVKDSGRGCTLSSLGYEHLTRPKSFHLRTTL